MSCRAQLETALSRTDEQWNHIEWQESLETEPLCKSCLGISWHHMHRWWPLYSKTDKGGAGKDRQKGPELFLGPAVFPFHYPGTSQTFHISDCFSPENQWFRPRHPLVRVSDYNNTVTATTTINLYFEVCVYACMCLCYLIFMTTLLVATDLVSLKYIHTIYI